VIAASVLFLALATPHEHHPAKNVAQATPAASGSPSESSVATPTAGGQRTVPATTPATASPYGYRFVPRQPSRLEAGQPQIFAVYINDKKLRSHGAIRIKVETSTNVVKVVSRSAGREGIIPLIAAGDFEATSVLPKIPFIAAGMSVDLEFVATGPDGRKTTVRVPVQLN